MANLYASIEIRKLEQDLMNAVNKSPLSLSIKQLVVKDVLFAIQGAADQEYEKDLAGMEKEAHTDVKTEN